MSVTRLQQAEHAPLALTDSIWFWLCLHLCVWTLYATISEYPGNVHHDMAEAFAWGREFEPGYYKHPPFWSHVAGIWFMAMPRDDWAFYLLSILNACIGLWGVWLIAGRFLGRDKRLVAVLLMQFVPFFHFLGFKYNANTILLSLWPFAIYFYLRLVDERSVAMGLMLGLVSALGMLSKYYFALLLVSFAVMTLADPRRRGVLATAAPWIAIATMTVVAAPHLVWLWQNDFLPFHYVSATIGDDLATRTMRAVRYLAGVAAFHIVMLLVFAGLAKHPLDAVSRVFSIQKGEHARNHLIALTILPHILTVAASLGAGVKIDPNFAVATLPLGGIILMTTSGVAMRFDALRRIKLLAAGFMLAMLLLSPAISYVRFLQDNGNAQQPWPEMARTLETIWDERVGTPLTIAAGTSPHAEVISFYAAGDVSAFVGMNERLAPWVTQERIEREGVAVLCRATDAGCEAAAQARLGEPPIREAFEITRSHWGIEGNRVDFVALLYPPQR
ncbi:MAG TPA: glycosyltransferase family 39 protein [Saliniramus sp.]|nr:glycosyltransferase family 39 protein [Saliniramus sp.]